MRVAVHKDLVPRPNVSFSLRNKRQLMTRPRLGPSIRIAPATLSTDVPTRYNRHAGPLPSHGGDGQHDASVLSVRHYFWPLAVGLMTIAASSLAPVAAVAATATGTFAVTATVQATCLVSATPLAFGTYTGTVLNNTANLTITCTNTTPYNILLNPGTSTGATVTTRKMTFGAFTLGYTLSANVGQTTNWGQTIGTDTVVGTGNGTAQTVTVYGQLTAGQFVNPGAYADTITATISY